MWQNVGGNAGDPTNPGYGQPAALQGKPLWWTSSETSATEAIACNAGNYTFQPSTSTFDCQDESKGNAHGVIPIRKF